VTLAYRIETPAIDWANPDFTPIYLERARRLKVLREDIRKGGSLLAETMAFYHEHPIAMVNDWAITVDPRVSGRGRSPVMPFVLFPRQVELAYWLMDRWHAGEPGIVEKSRDVGASWIAVALSGAMCLTHRDLTIGIGSYMQDKVDKSGDPDCLFYKARMFLTYLPAEISGGWDSKRHSVENRITFPTTDSSITGQVGDNIGRGGRKALYIVDESAHLERPKVVDASLAATTDCRIDMSSVNGSANSFAERRHSGKVPVFTFHWRDDPRKPRDFIERRIEAGDDPVMLDQEYNLDYSGMQDGQIIPARLVNLAVDAHVKLGIKPTGDRRSSFDVADVGRDKCAWGVAHGFLLEFADEWSGAGKDMLDSVYRAFNLCDEHHTDNITYDSNGMGAPAVEPCARVANKSRTDSKRKMVRVHQFRSSAAVMWPEQRTPGADSRKNEDMFQNFGAQSMWALKRRFEETERALAGKPYDPDQIISISGAAGFKLRNKLMVELSQPKWKLMETGKLKRDKTPDGAASPNLADMCMMLFAPRNRGLVITAGAADRLGAA
jgi:phage terminase large subunit